MPTIRTSVTIARPAEDVFDQFADGRLLCQWNPMVKGTIRLLTDEPIGQGTKFHLDAGKSGHDYELVEYDRPRRVTMLSPSPLGPLRHTILCEERNGETRLTQIATPSPRGLVWLLAWILKPLFSRGVRGSNRSLKTYLEQGAAAPAARP